MVLSILHIINVLFRVYDNILLNTEFVVLRGAQFGAVIGPCYLTRVNRYHTKEKLKQVNYNARISLKFFKQAKLLILGIILVIFSCR